MFHRILRKQRGNAPRGLQDYLLHLFTDPPCSVDGIHSLVHLRGNGAVNGFMGVLPMRFKHGDRSLKAAIGGSFMVDGHEEDPYAGARLLRAFQSGPQDLCLTETANDVSTGMWRRLRGTILPDYSLEWLRILRPAAFLAEMAANAFAPAAIVKPLMRPVDAILRRGSTEPQWSHVSDCQFTGKTLATADVDDEETVALFQKFTSAHALHPQWEKAELHRMVSESCRKANYGPMVRRKVLSHAGKPIGLFLLYGKSRGIGRVVQILSVPGHEGPVIDAMLAEATERKMAALRGRSQPGLLNAMLGRRFAFVHAASSIVYARDRTLLEPFVTGNAFFNGFAGESWTRLLGDRFD